jgi:hypothetical protein
VDRTCTKCGETLPATREFFYSNGERLRGDCKACTNARQREYTLANHDRYKAYWRRYLAEHREEKRAYRKRYYRENRPREIERAREWAEANPERRREIEQAYRDRNRR